MNLRLQDMQGCKSCKGWWIGEGATTVHNTLINSTMPLQCTLNP